MSLPNPGSLEAIAQGCKCPTSDNGRGRGYLGVKGIFVMNEDCPVHGRKAEENRYAKLGAGQKDRQTDPKG